MPLFDYCCGRHTTEELFFPNEQIPEEKPCSKCGGRAIRMLPVVAKTPGRWGDQTGKYGVNGFFDRGLGATYYNSMEKEKLMDAKGLTTLSSFGDDYVDDSLDKQTESDLRHERNIKTFKAKMAKTGGDAGKAIAETFTLSEMRKQGTLTDTGVNDG